ncbi:MAG: shikimate kinase [Desulfobacterales bacterium]|nr:shikimate kinase [Desulfobacterales bacterium]
MNIVLIGYRCSGKTEVGKILAKELGRDFLDTDALIEKDTGHSVEKIVSGKGWDHFREIEKRLVAEVSRNDHLVVATGGGFVMDEENVQNLKKNGWVVWLSAGGDVLKHRMDKDRESGRPRPSLTGDNPLEEIKEVLSIRKPLYERAGDFVVDTGTLSIGEVAATIINALPKGLQG